MGEVIKLLDHVTAKRDKLRIAIQVFGWDPNMRKSYVEYEELIKQMGTHYNYVENQAWEYYFCGVLKEMPPFAVNE